MSISKRSTIYPIPDYGRVKPEREQSHDGLSRDDFDAVNIIMRSVERVTRKSREVIGRIVAPIIGYMNTVEGTDIGVYSRTHPEEFSHLSVQDTTKGQPIFKDQV